MKTKIFVSTHREAPFKPYDDGNLYNAITLRDYIVPGWLNDGNGISMRNEVKFVYSAFSAMYWAWKNLHELEAIGFNHYRRYFIRPASEAKKLCSRDMSMDAWYSGKYKCILNQPSIDSLLSHYDCILPNKRKIDMTVYDQYVASHKKAYLDSAIAFVKSKYPQYSTVCDDLHHRKTVHFTDVFVMKYPIFDRYCRFIFDVGAHLEKIIDIKECDEKKIRCIAYVLERMLDIFIFGENISYVDLPVIRLQLSGKHTFRLSCV